MNKENNLNIKEIQYPYEYDVITCFEHPVMAVMEYFKHGIGRYYAMLSKLRGTYYSGNVREYVLSDMERILGFEIQELKKWNFKILTQFIDEGIPVIVGVNLKDIFYSSYYMEEDWVHWMLVTGYKCMGEIVMLLDNTQFENIGNTYGGFKIPFSMLQKAGKGYKKRYGSQYSLMAVICNDDRNKKDVFCAIINDYLKMDLNDMRSYRQLTLLNMYSRNMNKAGAAELYLPEFRKKLININKYRKLFFDEVENEMQKYGYSSDYISEYRAGADELVKKWQEYILLVLVKLNQGEIKEWKLNGEIQDLECNVRKRILSFVEYIDNKKPERKEVQQFLGYLLENNEDDIIQINKTEKSSKEDICFYFGSQRIYNWWDMDDAPKVIIKEPDMHQGRDFIFKTAVEIQSDINDKSMNYEAGIFIRDRETKESILLGIENGISLVVDEIGVTGHKFPLQVQSEYQLFISFKEGLIQFGTFNGDKRYIYYECGGFENAEIGMACKTWGKAGNVKVYFRETEKAGIE